MDKNKRKERISLKKRIAGHRQETGEYLKIFRMYTDSYFTGLCQILEDLYFADYYETWVKPVQEGGAVRLCDYLYWVSGLPEDKRNAGRYCLLVKPAEIMERSEER